MPLIDQVMVWFDPSAPTHNMALPFIAQLVAAIIHPALLLLVTLAALAVFGGLAAYFGYAVFNGIPVAGVSDPQLAAVVFGGMAIAVLLSHMIIRSIFKSMARASRA